MGFDKRIPHTTKDVSASIRATCRMSHLASRNLTTCMVVQRTVPDGLCEQIDLVLFSCLSRKPSGALCTSHLAVCHQQSMPGGLLPLTVPVCSWQ